jgi:hypothetical protein
MQLKTNIKMSSKGVKITYTKGRERWFGEMTTDSLRNGYGWIQWGAPRELLSTTTETTEQYCSDWIEKYMRGRV